VNAAGHRRLGPRSQPSRVRTSAAANRVAATWLAPTPQDLGIPDDGPGSRRRGHGAPRTAVRQGAPASIRAGVRCGWTGCRGFGSDDKPTVTTGLATRRRPATDCCVRRGNAARSDHHRQAAEKPSKTPEKSHCRHLLPFRVAAFASLRTIKQHAAMCRTSRQFSPGTLRQKDSRVAGCERMPPVL
jgi:hypothetical protein